MEFVVVRLLLGYPAMPIAKGYCILVCRIDWVRMRSGGLQSSNQEQAGREENIHLSSGTKQT